MLRIALLTLCFYGLVISRIEAQVQVRGQQDLAFGTIFAGVPEHVLPIDPTRSGRFRVQGPRNEIYVLTFTLPPDLFGPGAALLPMSYAVVDAGISATQTGPQTPFDPNTPFTFTMPNNRRVFISLGATATP